MTLSWLLSALAGILAIVVSAILSRRVAGIRGIRGGEMKRLWWSVVDWWTGCREHVERLETDGHTLHLRCGACGLRTDGVPVTQQPTFLTPDRARAANVVPFERRRA